MNKGTFTYLLIIAILVAAVLYLLWSQSQATKVSRPKKNVTINEENNEIYGKLIKPSVTTITTKVFKGLLRRSMNEPFGGVKWSIWDPLG